MLGKAQSSHCWLLDIKKNGFSRVYYCVMQSSQIPVHEPFSSSHGSLQLHHMDKTHNCPVT